MSRNFEIHQLIEAIETIKRNEVFFPSLAINNSIFKKDKFHLTCREIEIITLISLGHTSKEIANKLFLSQYTIDTHRKNCMRKLEVNSSLTLISAAKDLGYIL